MATVRTLACITFRLEALPNYLIIYKICAYRIKAVHDNKLDYKFLYLKKCFVKKSHFLSCQPIRKQCFEIWIDFCALTS